MSKGGNWERDVCKYLSKWINGTEKPYVFWKSGGSGSVFTISEGAAGNEFSGDIYAVREEGTFLTQSFSIECKSGYKNTSLDKFWKYNLSDPLKSFWEQCTDDAVKSNKFPMLIYRQYNNPTPWLGIDDIIFNKLQYKFFDENNKPKIRMMKLYWENDLPILNIFSYKEFFNCLTPKDIKEME